MDISKLKSFDKCPKCAREIKENIESGDTELFEDSEPKFTCEFLDQYSVFWECKNCEWEDSDGCSEVTRRY